MANPVYLTTLTASDHEDVAKLIHRSLAYWYESRLGQGARFGDRAEPFLLFPQVYEALDPGEGLAVRDSVNNDLLGVCFTHDRETHLSIGIVATSPDAAGRGVAKLMMEAALKKATIAGKPARLVSSLLNLDSFSLYTRMGFVPGVMFQDIQFHVPESGLIIPAPAGAEHVREVRVDEAAKLAEFEHRLQGIRREKDYTFMLRNEVGDWKLLGLENEKQEWLGHMAMSVHPSFCMIGPGLVVDTSSALALIWRALNEQRGKSPVILVPTSVTELVKTLYRWGGRNVELHVAQSTEPQLPEGKGISFPTFLPESA